MEVMHVRTRYSVKLLVSKALDLSRTEGFAHSARVSLRYLRNSLLRRYEAGVATLRGDVDLGKWIWHYRPVSVATSDRSDIYRDWVEELIATGQYDEAELALAQLAGRFQKTRAFSKLHTRIAIEKGLWLEALVRWQAVEMADPRRFVPLPAEWIYRIGVERARAQTAALEPGRLRALGMLSLASALRSVEEAQALALARGARRFYREHVLELVVRTLSANTRYTAAIWWAQRLIDTADTPRRYMPLLVEALIASSRLDECHQVLTAYVATYGRNTLWLRAELEISYRCSDFVRMHTLMQDAVDTRLPCHHKSVRVMDWLYKLIRLDPEPHAFLPSETQALAMKIASLYDKSSISGALRVLLKPDKADRIAQRHAAQIREARQNQLLIPATEQEQMFNIALRRRDWAQLEDLSALSLPDSFDTASAKALWNIARHRIDLHLAQADVRSAEATACAVLDQIAAQHHDSYAITLAAGLVFRLPLSAGVLDRLAACARRLDFAQMSARLETWQDRYTGLDPIAATGRAERRRCFILGNAPSIADLPLEALAGEDIFCVNRGMRAMALGLPQPKYLVVADPHVYRSHAREIDADGASVARFFIASNCIWRRQPNVPAIPFGSSGLKLSLRPLQPAPLHLHRGETVVVLAAQIAFQMGYREICILGVDLDYSGPVTHFYGGGRKETERLSNFRPGGSATEMVNLSFANLQKVVAPQGCRIFNAAPGGNLTVLERVGFEAIFKQPIN